MCGITGFAGIKAHPATLSSMIGVIKHRGPDDDGYCLHDDMGIGMTRLSIVDIAGGTQPMHTQDGMLSIVFNGEIYNHRELAAEYVARGGTLRTRSDTEVVLALFEREREACVEKLRGMFAFAILDRRDGSLFLARDRMGIKPLYYWNQGGKFVFGSEIKSLLESGQFDAEADMGAAVRYLSLRYVPGPGSLFKGVERLSPGHWMRWKGGTLEQRCYWQPQIREKASLSDQEFQERFDHLFEQSVDMRRMGDVPLGAYLSGGLDSASVANALARHHDTRLKTFTVGFGWEGDELNAARETAQLLGTEHREIICSPEDFRHLPRIVWHSDEPLGDPIVLPTYMLAQEASKHVKMVMTGEGADEILAGYLFHRAVWTADKYRRFCPSLLHRALVPLVEVMPVRLLNLGFNYPAYLGNKGKQRLLAFLKHARNERPADLLRFFITLFDRQEQANVLHPEFFGSAAGDDGHAQWGQFASGSVLDRLLRIQYVDWLPDNILMRQDKMSMAHGLEARVPFLDHKLVEFMETVPDHLKLDLRRNKILLRNYAEKNAIRQVARRKKNAFYFPMEEYFGGEAFQDLLSDTLGERPVRARGLFQHAVVKTLVERMKNKDFLAAKQVFSLMSLELWFQVFIDRRYAFGAVDNNVAVPYERRA